MLLHCLWLFAFPYLLESTYEDLLEDTAMTCYIAWIAINICFASIFMAHSILPANEEKATHNKA